MPISAQRCRPPRGPESRLAGALTQNEAVDFDPRGPALRGGHGRLPFDSEGRLKRTGAAGPVGEECGPVRRKEGILPEVHSAHLRTPRSPHAIPTAVPSQAAIAALDYRRAQQPVGVLGQQHVGWAERPRPRGDATP